ncbi:MAG: DUF6017 domain-containing protein [bacterium]|nr:DUF6017 domain-containing protein [bacterium]
MMSKKNNNTDNLPFFKLPKLLFTDAGWSEMSLDAKVLYGLFLDRLSLSKHNGWYDSSNRLYIIYSIESIRDMLKCGKSKAIKLMKELEAYGLIERLKRRKNLTDLIYVNRIDAAAESSSPDETEHASGADEAPQEEKTVEKNNFEAPVEFGIDDVPSTCIDTSGQSSGGANLDYGGAIFPPREVSKSLPNNTDFNNTECNNIVIDGWIDKMDGKSEIHTVKNKIKQQIEYDALVKNYPYGYQQGMIDEIIENIMEMYFMRSGRDISIGGCVYPLSYVKYRYGKLNYDSITYIMSSLEQNKSKVKNIKKYMTSVLFNATSTSGSYYSSEANHDMLNLKDDLSELLSRRIRI